MTDGQSPDTADSPTPDTPARRGAHADRLRYVPPVAALGTAFVLQVVLITDTVGTALADRTAGQSPDWPWYLSALLLGLAVASCVEGGAAYLMDLYDKHLLARDSVWLLRLGMVVYVAVSAFAVHWWAGQRDLPEVLAWVLAGMSASALFLWSRGSRWHQRDQMRAAGQLDPAMPRLSVPSKFWHPIRWFHTSRLISWEPVDTVADARARYDHWKDVRSGRVARTERYVQAMVAAAEAEIADLRAAVRAELDVLHRTAGQQAADITTSARAEAGRIRAEVSAEREAAARVRAAADSALAAANQRLAEVSARTAPDRSRPVRLVPALDTGRTGDGPTVDELADTLARRFPDSVPGRPKALIVLREEHGSCATERARDAIKTLAARRATRTADSPDSDDDEEDAVDSRLMEAAG